MDDLADRVAHLENDVEHLARAVAQLRNLLQSHATTTLAVTGHDFTQER